MGASGSAALEVAARLESAEVQVNRFLVSFQNLAIAVGDQFRLAAVEAVSGGTEISQALKEIVDAGTFDPIFDALNNFASELGELLREVAANLPEAFEGVEFDGLLDALGRVGDSLGAIFDDVDLSTPEGLQRAIQGTIDTMAGLANVTSGMVQAFDVYIDKLMNLVQGYNSADAAAQENMGKLLGHAKVVVDAGLEIAGLIVVLGEWGEALGPIFTRIGELIGGTMDRTSILFNGFKLLLYEVADALLWLSEKFSTHMMFGAFSEDIEANRAVLEKWKNDAAQNVNEAADALLGDLTTVADGFFNTGASAKESEKDIDEYALVFHKIPDRKETEVTATANSNDLAAIGEEIDSAIPDEKETQAKVNPDQPSIDKTKAEIDGAAPPEKKTDVLAVPDKPSFDRTTSAINEIPESKLMEIQLQGDIDIELARIKTQAESMDTAFEWTAKMNIAQVEADAKAVAAAFQAASDSVAATAQASADMFSSLLDNWDKLGWVEKRVMEGYLQQQMGMEQQALEMQERLTDAQIEYMEAKASALRDGDGLIKIESDGLEPALEMIMWQILEKVQLRVNEESAEFLLGLNPAT